MVTSFYWCVDKFIEIKLNLIIIIQNFIDTKARIIDSRSTDPATTNDFTHSAFRAFHFNCPEFFNTYDKSKKILFDYLKIQFKNYP